MNGDTVTFNTLAIRPRGDKTADTKCLHAQRLTCVTCWKWREPGDGTMVAYVRGRGHSTAYL